MYTIITVNNTNIVSKTSNIKYDIIIKKVAFHRKRIKSKLADSDLLQLYFFHIKLSFDGHILLKHFFSLHNFEFHDK